jgi:hypothetical protein
VPSNHQPWIVFADGGLVTQPQASEPVASGDGTASVRIAQPA